MERLLEFIPCESITGEALCQHIAESLTGAGLDVRLCWSQTMDGAGNMAGRHKGCSARFAKHATRAVHHYCSSHDLNLVLGKGCKLKEVHMMLETLNELGIFFKYSPKISRRLKEAIEQVNKERAQSDLDTCLNKTKFKVFCATRWVEKHTTLHDFQDIYELLLIFLEAINGLETNWDEKAFNETFELMKKIIDSIFIASFQIVRHLFGYTKGLSQTLSKDSKW